MPKKASGPKKARWSAAQKNEARKAPKKPHHRGQPDGPKSAPKRSARPDSTDGHTKRPRAERSPRWDREDPRRSSDSRGDSRGSRYSSAPTDRGNTSNRSTSTYSNRDDRNDRPKRWVSDSREERHVHRPHDERPRLERGERPVRDRTPRVADPARRDRHEGRRADPTSDRGGYQTRDDRSSGGYQGRSDRGTSGGYQKRDDRPSGGYQGRNDRGTSGGYQGQQRDDRSSGGYQGRIRPWHQWRLPGPEA